MSGEKKHEKVKSDQSESERRTYSVVKAGRILGISRAAAYQYARSGQLPTIRLGKRLLVPITALEKMLATT